VFSFIDKRSSVAGWARAPRWGPVHALANRSLPKRYLVEPGVERARPRFVRGGLCIAMSALLFAACGASTTFAIQDTDGGDSLPAGCPAAVPSQSDTCTRADLSCTYGCSRGGPATAECHEGSWKVARLGLACDADDASTDAPPDAPPPADGPFACEGKTCGPNQFCIHPCCGGAAPLCVAMPEGGACPSGTQPTSCQPFGGPSSGGLNCQYGPCKPPPAYCADSIPSGCDNNEKNSRTVQCMCA